MRYDELLGRLARNLREYRHAAGRSQEDLAHGAGMTVRAYGAIERGTTHDPGLETVWSLAEALGLSIEDLLVKRRPGPVPAPVKRGRKRKVPARR